MSDHMMCCFLIKEWLNYEYAPMVLKVSIWFL